MKIHQDFVDWMSGYCMLFDEMPDGAWQACCMEGVEAFNKDYGTNIDAHDGWLHWVKETSK